MIAPSTKKSTRRIGVFHGFMGVMVFIAYALPSMFVTGAIQTRRDSDRRTILGGNGGSLRRGFAVVKNGVGL